MTAVSDEGMWLLNDPPREQLKEKYDFDLTDAWLKNAMLASVRFNNGGSGGFVSPDGLLVTNHHIAADSLQKLSKPGMDLYRDGFYAATRERRTEVPRPRTERAAGDRRRDEGSERGGQAGHEAGRGLRRPPGASWRKIEKESLDEDRPALRRRHALPRRPLPPLPLQEVHRRPARVRPGAGHRRLRRRRGQLRVPAHEPRRRFFRAYENDKPAKTPHFFKWSETGPKENDLVFVTGHPGTTNRLETLAHA